MKLFLPGSNTRLSFPEELDRYFDHEQLIDVRSGKLMEMDGLYLYQAADLIEQRQQRCEIKERIIRGVIRNLPEDGSLWIHDSWNCGETHFRFTAAALETMILALLDDECSFDDRAMITRLAKQHLTFSDNLTTGKWFLHDSLEQPGRTYPDYHLKNRAFGSGAHNMMVLNTHVATLCLLNSLNQASLTDPEMQKDFDAGVEALMMVLEPRLRPFNLIESLWSRKFLGNVQPDNLVHKLVYRLRLPLKSRFPAFVHPDGYTERELSLAGVYPHYHVINLWDLASLSPALDASCTALVDDVVTGGLRYYAQSRWFQNHIRQFNPDLSLLVCETIQISYAARPERFESFRTLYEHCKTDYRTPALALAELKQKTADGAQ